MDTRLPRLPFAVTADALRAFARALTLAVPALLVALGLAMLPALAYASPADPSWVTGVWDGADSDDVVVLVGFSVKAVAAPAISHDRPARRLCVVASRDDAPSAPLRDVVRSRAPPPAG